MTSLTSENRYSFLTGPGKGAIGVAWFCGPGAEALLTRCFRPFSQHDLPTSIPGTLVYGKWSFAEPAALLEEDVIVLKRSNREYEVHVHGGGQSRAYLQRLFEQVGFCELPSGQWLSEQVGGGLSEAIAQGLLACQTERAARLLIGQEIAWSEWLERQRVLIAQRHGDELARNVEEVLNRKNLVAHLTGPWRVVLAGLPNAGKSSLINAICGFERAIVHSTPGTTRDVVTQQVVIDGWLFEIADTAGQRHAEGEIEQAGIERARAAWQKADCRVEVRDATRRFQADCFSIEPAADLVVANKVDLPEAEVKPGELPVSARTGGGLPQLQAALVRQVLPQRDSQTEPLPLSEHLVEVLEEIRRASRAADWTAVEVARERLAEYCGQQCG